MLPGHGNRDLFKHPAMTAVYSIRPYASEDKVRKDINKLHDAFWLVLFLPQVEVRRVSQEMQRAGEGRAPLRAQPPLIGDR